MTLAQHVATLCLGRGSGQGPFGAMWTEKQPMSEQAPFLSRVATGDIPSEDRTTGHRPQKCGTNRH